MRRATALAVSVCTLS